MVNRWIEERLLDVLGESGVGCIAFSPLAQGMLTDRYLTGIEPGSRAAQGKSLDPRSLDETRMAHVRALTAMARDRGQTLAQLALQWALRDPRVTSLVAGASSVEQLESNIGALDGAPLSEEELARIDDHAVEAGINLWRGSSHG
jgi:L-glyceraldehyde 3-phosphate reductase